MDPMESEDGMRTLVVVAVLLGLVLLPSMTGRAEKPRCKGDTKYYAGKCRSPREIKEMKRKAAEKKRKEKKRKAAEKKRKEKERKAAEAKRRAEEEKRKAAAEEKRKEKERKEEFLEYLKKKRAIRREEEKRKEREEKRREEEKPRRMIGQIRALENAGSPEWDNAIEALLVNRFDRNDSGTIDTLAEVRSIRPDVYRELHAVLQRDRGKRSGLTWTYGFEPDMGWVGGALGFDQAMREAAYKAMAKALGP